jgi:folylpolyglutamate synthase/dihydrofolate synthase
MILEFSPQNQLYLSKCENWNGFNRFFLLNIRYILNKFDNPQDKFPIIHVAGTNGKGGCSTLLAATYGSMNYKVGLLMSPHVWDVRERIIVDGEKIEWDQLDILITKIREVSESNRINLSLFEIFVICGFLYLYKQSVDIAIVEVGLGGRLDATNIIKKPLACLITSISFDHTNYLGGTRRSIVREKSKVVKSNTPLFIPNFDEDVKKTILSITNRVCSRVFTCSEYDLKSEIDIPEWVIAYSNIIEGKKILGLVKDTFEFLNPYIRFQENFWKEAYIPGRLERQKFGNKNIYIDCGHNLAGLEFVLNYFNTRKIKIKNIYIGILKKELWFELILKLKSFNFNINLIELNDTRGVSIREYQSFINLNGLKDINIFNYTEFILQVRNHIREDVLIIGSHLMIKAGYEIIGVTQERLFWKRQENFQK